MGDKSAIEWTDATWNPVTGCTKVSTGCKFCYAERITEKLWGQKFTEIRLHPGRLEQPLKWKKPRRIFVNSMSDLFHEQIPTDFIGKVFDVMAETPRHIFQILTKRPDRMITEVPGFSWRHTTRDGSGWPLGNVWLGVSVENQEQADRRIPLLLQTPAAVRFLSVEPLLGPIQFPLPCRDSVFWQGINWVIVGGESGGTPERALVTRFPVASGGKTDWSPKPEALEWVRLIKRQCLEADVPFFFKQWGGPTPKSGGRLLDGMEWNEYPGDHEPGEEG